MSLAFWGVAALLVAGALAFVLPPLWRRQRAAAPAAAAASNVYRAQREELDTDRLGGTLSEAQHAQALEALQRRALVETAEGRDAAAVATHVPARTSTLAVALALPACALALYGALGAPQAIEVSAAATQPAPHALTRGQVEVMVQGLIERLKAQPDDAEGWFMLARSHLAFGRHAQAAQAYERVARLVPGNPELLSDYADALAQVNGGRLEGRPLELVQAALKIDPAHAKSLALAGTAAYHQRAFDQAIDYWQQLQRTLPADSEQAREIESTIAQVRREAASRSAPAAPAAAPAAAAAADATSISGQVAIAASLQPRLGAGDTLFVFARAVEGPRMPLAIVRVPANTTWPFAFTLDDSQAMAPQMKLSSQRQVMLVARLSRSGQATPQSGDLTGTVGPVQVGQRDVRLVIDSVVP